MINILLFSMQKAEEFLNPIPESSLDVQGQLTFNADDAVHTHTAGGWYSIGPLYTTTRIDVCIDEPMTW